MKVLKSTRGCLMGDVMIDLCTSAEERRMAAREAERHLHHFKSPVSGPSRLLVVAILAVSLALSACSSGRSKSKSATSMTRAHTSMTRAQFVAQANAICQTSNEELGRAAQHAFGNQQPTADSWRPFMLTTVIPIIEQRLNALKALTPPASDTSTVSAIISAGQNAVATAKANPQMLSQSTRAPFDHYDDLASAYGVGCAVGG
jgi:hypothetical protein